jgi:hypothetical protein
MTRPVHLLIVLGTAGLAGWALAWGQVTCRQHAAEDEAGRAAAIEAKRPAVYFARLVRECDEAVISYGEVPGNKKVRISDPAWLTRLAAILQDASYKTIPMAFRISHPEIVLYRKQTRMLSLMNYGAVLRVLSDHRSGDFVVGKDVAAAIDSLALQ